MNSENLNNTINLCEDAEEIIQLLLKELATTADYLEETNRELLASLNQIEGLEKEKAEWQNLSIQLNEENEKQLKQNLKLKQQIQELQKLLKG